MVEGSILKIAKLKFHFLHLRTALPNYLEEVFLLIIILLTKYRYKILILAEIKLNQRMVVLLILFLKIFFSCMMMNNYHRSLLIIHISIIIQHMNKQVQFQYYLNLTLLKLNYYIQILQIILLLIRKVQVVQSILRMWK